MNKLSIIKEVAKSLSSEREAKLAVNRTFDIITEALCSNQKVVISNFGTFRTKERLPRQMRNPKTNQKVMVGSRRSIRFKPSRHITAPGTDE